MTTIPTSASLRAASRASCAHRATTARKRPQPTTAPQRTAFKAPARKARPSLGRLVARGLLASILILILAVGAFYGVRGWSLYRDAAQTVSLDQAAAGIRSSSGFTRSRSASSVWRCRSSRRTASGWVLSAT